MNALLLQKNYISLGCQVWRLEKKTLPLKTTFHFVRLRDLGSMYLYDFQTTKCFILLVQATS